ncbi:MAG: carbamoyltransferase HypF, partial [Acidobacteriota bacterium]
RNDAGGVTIEAFGSALSLDRFLAELQSSPPPAAQIRSIQWSRVEPRLVGSFEIVASAYGEDRQVSIPADLATCADCLADVRDRSNRRHRYPFTNCTNCGPRFTIAHDVPYDRPNTSMAAFRMCAACQAEYECPEDRRFHAQPNACPLCGPRVWITDQTGIEVPSPDPLAAMAHALCQGRIAAIKGLGGFHLACDATSENVVAELRRRKRRDEKPFAVMVGSLDEAEQVADLSDADRALLLSIERPIVLVPRKHTCPLAEGLAPRNPTIGLMLPYSPLHHILLQDVSRPLVMTSGNMSEEPLAYRNDEAFARLGRVADLFLVHDRDIDTRCDDSVARIIAGKPVVLRRARGYVPRGIPVRQAFAQPVLACGALLKNTFCFGTGDTAYLGPHIGDLENLETYESFEHAVGRMERFLAICPSVVAYDLHPAYLSSRYALRRPEPVKIAVQHHHAHVASAMAEHGLDEPVIGVVYDGTGLGTDGTAWGGEILLADYARFERLATFRPIRLAGGDLAIRQVWRQAYALLDDAFDGDPPIDRLPVFGRVPKAELTIVRQMLDTNLNTVQAHGVGRYFDAMGAIGLRRPISRYEGQIALEWNLTADPADDGRYAFGLDDQSGRVEIDLRPAVRAMVGDLIGGQAASGVSARFHNTLALATAEVVRMQRIRHGPVPVVLTGGCFQNARLAESVVRELGPGVQVLLHESVPPGDGGLALGQAVVANAIVQSGSQVVTEELCA